MQEIILNLHYDFINFSKKKIMPRKKHSQKQLKKEADALAEFNRLIIEEGYKIDSAAEEAGRKFYVEARTIYNYARRERDKN